MVNSNLRQHRIVFDLGLSEWRAVVGNDDQLTCKPNKNQIHPQNADTQRYKKAWTTKQIRTTDPFTAQRKNANIVVSYNGDSTN